MRVRIGEYGELDLERMELRLNLVGRTVKLRPASIPPPHFIEPFSETEEPDTWVRIEGKHVFVKSGEKMFEGELP